MRPVQSETTACLTSEFEMGSGGTTLLWSPKYESKVWFYKHFGKVNKEDIILIFRK